MKKICGHSLWAKPTTLRNYNIYDRWRAGASFEEIGAVFGLSFAQVRTICVDLYALRHRKKYNLLKPERNIQQIDYHFEELPSDIQYLSSMPVGASFDPYLATKDVTEWLSEIDTDTQSLIYLVEKKGVPGILVVNYFNHFAMHEQFKGDVALMRDRMRRNAELISLDPATKTVGTVHIGYSSFVPSCDEVAVFIPYTICPQRVNHALFCIESLIYLNCESAALEDYAPILVRTPDTFIASMQ